MSNSTGALRQLISPLLLASTNPHKAAELKPLFVAVGVRLQTADECGLRLPAVAEDGDTIERIATDKACAAAHATGRVCIADDTVLEVDALDGAPGLRTARFAGEGATAQQNGDRLLSELTGVPDALRTGRFVCCLCIAFPGVEEVVVATGSCRGRIMRDRHGEGGFGYDAMFWVDATDCTMAELSPELRLTVTHRANAFSELAKQLGLPRLAP